MALSIVSQPAAIAPVKQPIRLVQATNNFQLTSGTAAVLKINIVGTSDGQLFTLRIAGQLYTFTAKTTPDTNNGFEYFTNADPIEICNQLQAMFNALPFFADNYTVSSNGTSWVQLAAKKAGQSWTMVFAAGTTSFTQNTNTTGVDATYRPNFKVELLITQGSNILRKEASVNSANEATFILEELLEALLPSFYLDLSGEYLFAETSLLMPYTLAWNENYGTIPLSMRRSSASYKAMPGLFDKASWPTASLAAYTTNTTARKFLTHMPRVVEAKLGHKMLLYIYQDGSKAQVNIVGKLVKRNEKNYLLPQTALLSVADYADMVGESILAFGFDLSWFANEIGGSIDDVAELQLGLSFGTSEEHFSELLTVIFDHSEPSESEVALLFKSQAGVMELAYFEGDQELSLRTSRSLGELVLPANYTKATGEIQAVEVSRQREFKLHSGFKSRDYIVWLQELAGSDEVYMLDGQFNRLRVNITGSGNDLAETNQEVYSMTLTVQEAFIDRT